MALAAGDELLDSAGNRLLLERVGDFGKWSAVYNLEVEADHTYFAGSEGWGFDVWSHNHQAPAARAAKSYPKDYPTCATNDQSAHFPSEGAARNYARTKVGSDPVTVEPHKMRSVDGKWQYRAKPGDVAERHVHLEELDPITGEVLQNWHLRWPEGMGR